MGKELSKLDKELTKYIKLGKELSSYNPLAKKHISLIIRKNRILAIGVNNSFKSHPIAKKLGYRYEALHSELDAYNQIDKGLDKLILLNMRFNSNQELRNSKPCPICLGWCKKIFDEIYYTDSNGIKSY